MTMAGSRDAMIRAVPLFGEATATDVAALAEAATEIRIPAGRTIVRQGDPANGLFVIVDGRVHVVRDGERIASLGAGEWFGELAVLDRGPRLASVVADTDVLALALAAWDAERLLLERPGLALGVARTLATRLRTRTEDHDH